MNKIQNTKRLIFAIYLIFWIWSLFVIWCLSFEILEMPYNLAKKCLSKDYTEP